MPTDKAFAGMLIVAYPVLKEVTAELYFPPDKVIEPVGVGLFNPPLTSTVIARD